MRALPTTYGGQPFRSRLEADWACTLDHAGIDWVYEPEGFELSDGTRYLPDFWLPRLRTWLEVKGPHEQRKGKVEAFAREVAVLTRMPAPPADDARDRQHASYARRDHPLVLLGQLPHAAIAPGMPKTTHTLGVKPGGGAFSVDARRCPECRERQWAAIGATQCRVCDFAVEHYLDWPEPEEFHLKFGFDWVQARRPHDDAPYDWTRYL